MEKSWFNVDREGLKALQANKPKAFIINELVQNAFDEPITFCKVTIKPNNIIVEDDSPEGFKHISHAYTLFADTYKRRDPTKRGRFNLGEKQVIALCKSASVSTTKGTIIFNDEGRTELPDCRNKGSLVDLKLDLTTKEVNDIIKHANSLLAPSNIRYIVNDKIIKSKYVFKSFKAKLITEVLENDIFRPRVRETKVNLIESTGQSWIYEMGIPIVKTDCPWHIDVQQKVQLNIDRDNILPSYVQDLYAEVLNQTHDYLEKEQVSALWVRTATKDERTTSSTVKSIMTKRFGSKFCIGNPLDKSSISDAISKGYNVIFGGEMSKDEWARVKEATNIESTSSLFGHNEFSTAEVIEPTIPMTQTALYTKDIAKRILNIKVDIKFVRAPLSNVLADYNRAAKIMRFNVSKLPRNFFDKPVSAQTTKLIIHELSHEDGTHTDYSYQEMQSTIGAELIMLALREPQFFKVN